MVNIWHILDYSYIVLFLQYPLSHPLASCSICSLPLLISQNLLKFIWYLIPAVCYMFINGR